MGSVERATNTVRFSKEYYVHPVFQNYAASKTGEEINVKTMLTTVELITQ